MIDLHAHVLPGLDDGAPDLAASIQMVRAAEEAGIETIVATPHIRADFDVRIEEIARRVEELNRQIEAGGLAVRVRAGGEVAMTRSAELTSEELSAVSLGGASRYILLEPPYGRIPDSFAEHAIADLEYRGFVPIIAHPERNPSVMDDPTRAAAWVERGALIQVTAASVLGAFGRRVRGCAERLLRGHLVHSIASDSHGGGARPPRLAEATRGAARIAGDEDYAAWLTRGFPAAVLADEDINPSAWRHTLSPLPPFRWRLGRRAR